MKSSSSGKVVRISLNDERYTPVGRLLKASIEELMPGYGRRIAFNNRHTASVQTGVNVVELPKDYILKVSLYKDLAEKGLVLSTNTIFDVGPISLTLVNCGREIVNLMDGDNLAYFWLEKVENYNWSVVDGNN